MCLPTVKLGFKPVYLTPFDGFTRDMISAEATGSTTAPAK